MGDPFNSSSRVFNRTPRGHATFGNLEDIDVTADRSPVLRIMVSVVYILECAIGLVGNSLVIFIMRVKHCRQSTTINVFIINLAVTDLQFVLTLPFWSVDTALDFSWPFGDAMCKIILSVTVMNMYASVFFLTAMSITRYCSVNLLLCQMGLRIFVGLCYRRHRANVYFLHCDQLCQILPLGY
uniref:G-protein coupled receptors family 1 profile domain-containing protein n=1 Tax=Sinocyclocheilus grahami TaxID=75366 RepID=A0A672SZW6_SINGR